MIQTTLMLVTIAALVNGLLAAGTWIGYWSRRRHGKWLASTAGPILVALPIWDPANLFTPSWLSEARL